MSTQRGRRRGCNWSSPTSIPRVRNSRVEVSTRVSRSTSTGQRAPSRRAPIPTGATTTRFSASMTRTGTAGWCRRSAGLRPDERGFDAPDVAILIAENGLVDVAEALELAGQHSGLVTAELEQKRAPVPEKASSVMEDASQDVGPVGAAVVGERRFEREGVPLKERQLGGRHVRDDSDDDVDAGHELTGERREEVAAISLDPVRRGACDRTLVDVGGYDTCARAVQAQDAGDGAGSGAEVDCGPIPWQAFDRTSHQRLR